MRPLPPWRAPVSRCTVIPALALIALAHAAPAQTLDPARALRIDSVFAAYATPTSPGCALAVTRRGTIVYERGYGMASLEQNVPITPRTVFDLGSVSKQFTAASVLLLQLDGKLSLDDDVRRYLPELPSLGATVTLRHLITHTSGWRDYNDLLAMDGFDERDHTTDRDAWDSLVRQRALNFQPGATFRYSNTGFFLLGEVVKRVTGRSLAAFAEERIFSPLGMSHTRYLDDTRQIVPGRATAYAPAANGFVVEMSNWDQVGDGAVQSSVEDLARWEANFDSGVVGGSRLMELLLTNGRLSDGMEIAYTAGLSKTTYRGVAVVSHGGAWAGYRAQLARVPAERVGVLITCNRADAGTGNLSNRVLGALLTLEAPQPIATANGEQHEGFFVSDATGSTATFETRGDTLFQATGAQRLPYARTGDGTFVNAVATVRLRFTGTRVIRTALGDVADTLAPSARVTTLPNDRLADYVGTYSSPEIATSYRVMVRDSALVLRRSHGDDVPLAAVYPDGFDAESLPTIRFVRDARGRVTAMSFTGRGIHDLRLARRSG